MGRVRVVFAQTSPPMSAQRTVNVPMGKSVLVVSVGHVERMVWSSLMSRFVVVKRSTTLDVVVLETIVVYLLSMRL